MMPSTFLALNASMYRRSRAMISALALAAAKAEVDCVCADGLAWARTRLEAPTVRRANSKLPTRNRGCLIPVFSSFSFFLERALNLRGSYPHRSRMSSDALPNGRVRPLMCLNSWFGLLGLDCQML